MTRQSTRRAATRTTRSTRARTNNETTNTRSPISTTTSSSSTTRSMSVSGRGATTRSTRGGRVAPVSSRSGRGMGRRPTTRAALSRNSDAGNNNNNDPSDKIIKEESADESETSVLDETVSIRIKVGNEEVLQEGGGKGGDDNAVDDDRDGEEESERDIKMENGDINIASENEEDEKPSMNGHGIHKIKQEENAEKKAEPRYPSRRSTRNKSPASTPTVPKANTRGPLTYIDSQGNDVKVRVIFTDKAYVAPSNGNKSPEDPSAVKEEDDIPTKPTARRTRRCIPVPKDPTKPESIVGLLPKKEDGTGGEPVVQNILGDDGNLYYCHICLEVGDVVCCDGCPKVYHPKCVPKDSPSWLTLNEDQWFCPNCIKKQENGRVGSKRRKNSLDISDVDNREEEDNDFSSISERRSKRVTRSLTSPGRSRNLSDVRHAKQRSKRPRSQSELAIGSPKESTPSKRRRISSLGDADSDAEALELSPRPKRSQRRVFALGARPKPVHAFNYYLLENRIKIERLLARKRRHFRKTPRGYDKNYMIAKEGASWWMKTTYLERKKYIDMSLQEFEENCIEWMEDKNISEMMEGYEDSDMDEGSVDSENDDASIMSRDANDYWLDHHRHLSKATSIKCRPVRHEITTGVSNNRVLLELLQDTRFNRLPMLEPNRDISKVAPKDNSNAAVPHLSIQGPIATGVGDECMGCVRGWNHFCPILKQPFPAVEHRAKLQAPCSNLLTTRIGAGLPLSKEEDAACREAANFKPNSQKRHKDVPNLYLTEPSSRADDVSTFIEAATATKVPDVAAEPTPILMTKAVSKKMTTPNDNDENRKNDLFVCGQCSTIISSREGCIPCRRGKLVIEMSRSKELCSSNRAQAKPDDTSTLKVQATMLGRCMMKQSYDEFNLQKQGDKAVANALITRPWKPSAVLPPLIKLLPSKKDADSSSEGSDSDSDSDSKSSSNTEESHVNVAQSIEIMKEATSTSIDHPTLNVNSQKDTSNPPTDEDTLKESTHGRQRNPRRLTRNNASKTSEDDENRQALAKEHKDEADEIQRRCLSLATCGIFLGLVRRDPLRLFAKPVPQSVEGYHKIIKTPMDFGTIREKVLAGQYATLKAFGDDVRQLCRNSLAFNPPGSIYFKTANEIMEALPKMHKRASDWMYAIKNSHASHFARFSQTPVSGNKRRRSWENGNSKSKSSSEDGNSDDNEDPFHELRQTWPDATDVLENGDYLKEQVQADFIRTKENEIAYYGTIAVRRAAKAAEASMASYDLKDGRFEPCIRRGHEEDEELRKYVDDRVSEADRVVQLQDRPTSRETDILRILKKVQKRRVEISTQSISGCARCDGSKNDKEAQLTRTAETMRRRHKAEASRKRIDDSRLSLSTGLASKRERDRLSEESNLSPDSLTSSVSVRGSNVHGWGLFADHPIKKGALVAEYVGEYVSIPTANAREKFYEERRIQDYQFRVSANHVIDATIHGGYARYMNHSCDPNCFAKIINGEPPNEHLKRVVVYSQRDIEAQEEVTYDYQFPLEFDISARITCNCGAKNCRGFMNWDLPESGSFVAQEAGSGERRHTRIRRIVRQQCNNEKK